MLPWRAFWALGPLTVAVLSLGFAFFQSIASQRMLVARESLPLFFPRLAIPQLWTSVCVGLVVGSLVWQTERQLGHWQDSETLLTHTLALEPKNPVALSQYGAHKHRTGQDADAERLLLEALERGGDCTWLLA